MNCPECGNEINGSDVFCGNCGAEIINNGEAVSNETAAEEKRSRRSSKSKNSDKKKTLKIIVRIIGAAVIIAAVIIIIVFVSASMKASEGRKIFEKIPLGRDIDIIESTVETAFIGGESSQYGALNHIADYDYICESEKSVNVGGIEVPEWAVLLRKNDGGAVGEAVLYNFYVIKHNWMGSKTAGNLETSAVNFGVSLKSAERTLGLKPYTIVKESTSNTSTYVYRYHYVDGESGNTIVKNFYIVVSDVDNQVKDVRDEQLDYLKMILQGEE
ncbi:MAG: zinc ribbon domain-containing protein [Prevotella sp.]|nr:zinc ribbon domain-containing protein [Prevotella sp.]